MRLGALLRRLRWPLRLRAPLLVLAVAYATWHRLTTRHLPQTPTLAWGGVMLVSFVGWGSLVNWFVSRRRVADVGLRAMWGVSLTLFLGGVLCALHRARPPMILAHTYAGVVLAAFFSVKRARLPSLRTWRVLVAAPGLAIALAGGYAASLVWFYGNMGNSNFSDPDDYILYFTLAKKILATGTMFEPLGARRILTLGGQDYLHAMYMVHAPLRFIHGLDRGIFVVITIALVAGAFTADGLRARYVLPLGLALLTLFWVPEVINNSASLYSGVAALLGVWRTLRWAQSEPAAPGAWSFDPPRLVVLGLSAVTCIILRPSNLLPAVTFLGLAILLDYARVRRPARTLLTLLGAYMILALAAACALAPWSILLRQSCGTFLFPVWHGNMTPGFEILHKVDKLGELTSSFVGSLFHDRTLQSCIVLALAGMVPMRGRGAQDGLAFTVAALCGLVGVSTMGAWWGPEHLPRYYFSYFAATGIALAASAKSALGRGQPMQMARLGIIAGAVASQVVAGREGAKAVYTFLIVDVNNVWARSEEQLDDFTKGDKDYEDIQSHLPAAAKVAVAVLQPYRFDFGRNEIDSLDSPMGGMGPAPGFPVFKGPEALASYLEAQGIRYLVFTSFGAFSYAFGKQHWEDHLKNDKGYLKAEAPYQLDVIASIEELAKTREEVHKAGPMTLIDLEKRR